ncbi:hypothetical protein [Micromonospora sp. NPDC003241]
MSAEHSYTSGVEKMLFVLSRGFCYAPTCKNPVVRFEAGGDPEVTVFIAHIRAARPNGPRWVAHMKPEERKSFSNLLLLCKKHHTMVDSKNNEKKYPIETLEEWKKRREEYLGSRIAGLATLTEDRLIELLGKVAAGSRHEILEAIEQVHGISQEVREMLKTVVDEPYRRPIVDPDALASLEHSAGMLSFLQDHTPILAESADAIASLADHGSMLIKFSNAISAMPDLTAMGNLEEVAVRVGLEAERVQTAAQQVEQATARLSNTASALASDASRVVPYQREEAPSPPAAAHFVPTITAEELRSLQHQQAESTPEVKISRKQLFLRGMALGAAIILLIQLTGILFFR